MKIQKTLYYLESYDGQYVLDTNHMIWLDKTEALHNNRFVRYGDFLTDNHKFVKSALRFLAYRYQNRGKEPQNRYTEMLTTGFRLRSVESEINL